MLLKAMEVWDTLLSESCQRFTLTTARKYPDVSSWVIHGLYLGSVCYAASCWADYYTSAYFQAVLFFLAVARGKVSGDRPSGWPALEELLVLTHPGQALWDFSPAAGAADGGKASGPHGALTVMAGFCSRLGGDRQAPRLPALTPGPPAVVPFSPLSEPHVV